MPPRTNPHLSNQPEVEGKIDAHIKENPKHWAYLQGMPRDRLERTVVLNEVRQLERQERMRDGIMKQNQHQSRTETGLRVLVKSVPEEQREEVMSQILAPDPARRFPLPNPATNQRTSGGCLKTHMPV